MLNDFPESVAEAAELTPQSVVGLLRQFAHLHTHGHAANGTSPWLGESMHPETGVWLSRQIMYDQHRPAPDRDRGICKPAHPHTMSSDLCAPANAEVSVRWAGYNSATWADLIINVLVGLRTEPVASSERTFVLNPLAGRAGLRYFALDNLRFRGANLAIVFDADGQRYRLGKGLRVFTDGQLIASSDGLGKLEVTLPATGAGDA